MEVRITKDLELVKGAKEVKEDERAAQCVGGTGKAD